MEDALRKAVRDAIVDSMPVGLMVINHEGQVVLANNALEAMLGFSRDQLMSAPWGALFFAHAENHEFNDVIMDVIRRELVNLHRTLPYKNPKDGRLLMLSIISSYLSNGGDADGVVLMVEDVTESHTRQQREKRLLWERNLLQRERADGLKKLALSVAHQVRNPAMTIAGFARSIGKEDCLSEGARERVDIILKESAKLETTVNTVAGYASLPRPALERVVVGEALQELKHAPELEHDPRLRLAGEENALRAVIAADRSQLLRALRHIVDNGLEFCENGVEVAARLQDNGDLAITIQDDGPGIPSENLPYIFDPFYTTKPQAVGMGLTEARHIVLDNHGELEVESPAADGRGALFRAIFSTTNVNE